MNSTADSAKLPKRQRQAAVKICGIRTPETLVAVQDLPIDYVGFVFARSKRQISPQEAGRMIALRAERSGSGVEGWSGRFRSVGVFVDAEPELLEETLRMAPLDAVQLHGRESPAYCRWVKDSFGVEVWRSWPAAPDIRNHADGETAIREHREALAAYAGTVDVILLDTAGGGSGLTFDWRTIPAYHDWCRANGIRLFVAGGLTPDNVGELLEAYMPDGVDVSSGVETEGSKDIEKIKRFVERVKRQ